MQVHVGQHWNLQGVCLYTIYEASVHGFSVSCAKQYGGCISLHNEWAMCKLYGGHVSIQNDMLHCPLYFTLTSDDGNCPVWYEMSLTLFCWTPDVSTFKCLFLKHYIVVAFSVTTGFSFSVLIKSQWRVIEMFYHSNIVFLSNSWRSSPIKNHWPAVSLQTFPTSLHTRFIQIVSRLEL